MAKISVDYQTDDEVELTVELSDADVERLLSDWRPAYGLLVTDAAEIAPHRFDIEIIYRTEDWRGHTLCRPDSCPITKFLESFI